MDCHLQMWDLQLVVFSEETVDVIEASLRFCSLSRTNFVRDELARGRGSVNFQDLPLVDASIFKIEYDISNLKQVIVYTSNLPIDSS